jgi:hypothetical protein
MTTPTSLLNCWICSKAVTTSTRPGEVLVDGSRLSDHSGLAVRLATTPTTALLTSDPTTAAPSESGLEPTLF